MTRLLSPVSLAIALLAFTAEAPAQFFGDSNFNDPFFQYYGFYLPRQAAMAMQPRPQDSINALAAQRQFSAMTERASLYDPIQPFGTYDPNALFGGTGGLQYGGMATHGTNINGSGPAGYYNRTHSYFPGLRSGRAAAAMATPAYTPRRGGYGVPNLGGMGMGGIAPPMPGR